MEIKNESILKSLIEDIENIMTDIFLSGFYGVQLFSLEKIEKKENLLKSLEWKTLQN